MSQSGSRLEPGMEVGSVVLDERKSERDGPVLRFSAKVVWGRRGLRGGEMVARHRMEGEGVIDSLEGDSEVACVCAISL